MAPATTTTVDHDEIRSWVERHGGSPASARDRERHGGAELLIAFSGGGDRRLERLSWEQWFAAFDRRRLAFVYPSEPAAGDDRRSCALVSRQPTAQTDLGYDPADDPDTGPPMSGDLAAPEE